MVTLLFLREFNAYVILPSEVTNTIKLPLTENHEECLEHAYNNDSLTWIDLRPHLSPFARIICSSSITQY